MVTSCIILISCNGTSLFRLHQVGSLLSTKEALLCRVEQSNILRQKMPGNKLQRERLKYEKGFLEKYFSGEKFPKRMKNGDATFERDVKTSNGNIYRLRIYVGENYPRQLPELVVCGSPKPMPKWGVSHETHTYEPKDGLLRICFFHPFRWTSENRLYEVFNKGEEWLEAYEQHLVTGEKMCEILPEMEPFSAEVIEAFKQDLIRKQKVRKCAKFWMPLLLIVFFAIVYYLFITN